MKKRWMALLTVAAIACLAASLYYPARYFVAKYINETQLDELREIRRSAQETAAQETAAEESAAEESAQTGEVRENETGGGAVVETPEADLEAGAKEPLPYYDKVAVVPDLSEILPQYRALYEQNNDLVGWLLIEDMGIDYPVLQTPGDDAYYLHRDFYGHYNFNGQLILDGACDPFTPSYNLIIYGHNMNNGTMFGTLKKYADPDFWRRHKRIEFDSLMEQRQYVVAAVFFGAEYAEGEKGFRYALDFRDEGEYAEWMRQVEAAREYDTGVDCAFGDEFITLSTCAYHVKNGRFAVVARRLREGETFENEE